MTGLTLCFTRQRFRRDSLAAPSCEVEPSHAQAGTREHGVDRTRRLEEPQEPTARRQSTSGDHQDDVSKVSGRVRHVHQEPEVAPVSRDRDEPLENRRVDGNVRQIQARTQQDHEPEAAEPSPVQPGQK
jgi:hypothetical protein